MVQRIPGSRAGVAQWGKGLSKRAQGPGGRSAQGDWNQMEMRLKCPTRDPGAVVTRAVTQHRLGPGVASLAQLLLTC